jgi:hypothetical protein
VVLWAPGLATLVHSELPDNGAQSGRPGFDTLGKLEAHQGPSQIVFRVPGLEVDIPFRTVGE